MRQYLKEICDIIDEFPDLRIGQVISNAVREVDPAIFYVTDIHLLEYLEQFHDKCLLQGIKGKKAK